MPRRMTPLFDLLKEMVSEPLGRGVGNRVGR
jgi:hypothetical protein